MRIEKVDIDSINDIVLLYDYVLVYEYSRVLFSDAAEASWNYDELNEAYLFNSTEQIHIFKSDGEFTAIKLTEEKSDITFCNNTYVLDNKFKSLGTYVVIREYLVPDEDGQAFVKYTRLVEVR